MIAAMLALYVMFRARRENFGAGEPFRLRVFLTALGRSLWALGAPVIILGGIYGGVFSPTEAAAVACVYAAFVTAFVFRELTCATSSKPPPRPCCSRVKSSSSWPALGCSRGS